MSHQSITVDLFLSPGERTPALSSKELCAIAHMYFSIVGLLCYTVPISIRNGGTLHIGRLQGKEV